MNFERTKQAQRELDKIILDIGRKALLDKVRATFKPGQTIYTLTCCGDVWMESTDRGVVETMYTEAEVINKALSEEVHTLLIGEYVFEAPVTSTPEE